MNFDPATGDFQPPGEEIERPPEAFRNDTSAKIWSVVFGILLAFWIYTSVSELISGLQTIADSESEAALRNKQLADSLTAASLWFVVIITFIITGILPTTWVALTRVDWRLGTPRYFFMTKPESWGREIGWGAALAGIMLGALLLIGLIQGAITGTLTEAASNNTTELPPLIEAFDRLMTWPLAIAIALGAAVGEELFFRGVLQRWLGWWGQAIVFGLTHAGYGTVSQIVVPFAIGLAFGYLIKRGWRIWPLMVAHFLYDFLQLGALVLI